MTDLDPRIPALIETAADLIERYGLAHGNYQLADGSLCTAGALRKAVWGVAYPSVGQTAPHTDGWELYCEASNALSALVDPGRVGVVHWNDERDQAEVLAGLRAAAAQLRAGVTA